MRLTKVTCDGCGKDLTTRTNCEDYRLVLESENKPGHGAGFYTSMAKWPPLDRAHHFCDLMCLDHWRERESYYRGRWKSCMDEWKEKHGKKRSDGRVLSYSSMPEDVWDKHDAEIRAAALAAFPLTSSPLP